ncbi:MAG: DUF5916 domain-containing protein, partial [bacterium]
DTLHALAVNSAIHIDGRLEEPFWHEAQHIRNFTQRELNEGEPATERTEVAMLYDPAALFIGVWCYDREPSKLVAQKMKRDFDFDTEDNFEVIIDTYHDQRNGYLFVTNPNGALADVLVINNGSRVNEDWDGVWTVATSKTDQGWFAEFRIPFSTLKFPSTEKQIWGINFERNIRHKREQLLWQGWSRDSELEQVSRAGRLVGLRGINSVRLLEFRPYVLGGLQQPRLAHRNSVKDLGGGLYYLITPTMKLNLTGNPDFAQVESDRAQINLTRFSLFFPEKRKFFLEGQNFFNFGLGHSIRPFYSRRIGLTEDGQEVRILGGARVLGKEGHATLGGMVLQTAKKDSLSATNYAVVRWKQDIFQQSTVGVIAASKIQPGRTNATYGFDFLYSTSSLFGDKNFTLGAALAHSFTSDAVHKTGAAHRLFIDYPNDIIDFSAVWDRSSEHFNPEVGFLRRTNYQMYNADLRIKPRPPFLPWIRNLEFKPLDFNYYVDDRSGELQSLWTEFRPLGFSTKSGEAFEFNIQRSAEHLSEDFDIHDGVTILPGTYWFTHYELQFETFQGRPVFGEFFVNWGDFYNGTRTKTSGRLAWQVNKYFSIRGDYQQNNIALPPGSFTVHEVGGRVEFAFNPRLFGSVFGQWNDEDEEILLNFRINWIPKPETDLFFVINQSVDTMNKSWVVSDTTVLTKFVWRFVL